MTYTDPDLDGLRAAATQRMRGLSRTYLLRGAIALALGLVALFWPQQSLSLLLRIAGVFLILDGAATLFGARGRAGAQADTGSGVVGVLIGIVLLLLPATSAKLAFFLIGVWALVTAGSYLVAWWQMPKGYPDRDMARNAGLLAGLAGLVLVIWPGTGLVLTGWGLALVAFVVAATMFFLAAKFRGAKTLLAEGGPRR
jgi:uncharacterized membrane protein HdeD (DUF308 family)